MTLFCDIMNSTLPCYYTTEGTYTDILTTKTHSKQITDFPFVLFHFVLFRFVLQITVSLSKNKEQQQNTLPLWSTSFTCVRRLWRLRYNTINIILIQWHNINSKIQPIPRITCIAWLVNDIKILREILQYAKHYLLWSLHTLIRYCLTVLQIRVVGWREIIRKKFLGFVLGLTAEYPATHLHVIEKE